MPDTKKISAMTILKLPPVQLERVIESLRPVERDELSRELESIAAFAAFAGTYFAERAGQCGSDVGHDRAVAKANKSRKAVRKSFGYLETRDLKI